MNSRNRTKPILRPALLTAVVLGLTGCAHHVIRYTSADHDRLMSIDTREIDVVDLGSLSDTIPISVEEASERYREEVLLELVRTGIDAIGLDECRAAALQNNLDLRVQRVAPSIASALHDVESAKFEAVLQGGAQHSQSKTPTASQLEGSEISSSIFQTRVLKPLPIGGELAATLTSGRLDTDNRFAVLDPSFESDLTFSISQPLLRGAGARTNTHSIRVAALEMKISDARTKLEAIRVLAAAEQAYWLVYGASAAIGVRRQQYDLAMQQLNEAHLRVRAKAAPRVEITRAESGVAARLEGIILAETQMRIATRDLRRIMTRPDMPIESDAPMVLASLPNPVGLSLDPRALADSAVQNRMEMLELELQLAIDESTIDVEENARLPLFVLDYEYNVNGLGSSFGRAHGQLGSVEFADWTVGFRGEVPIGNRAAKARVRHALLIRAQRLATRGQREQAIRQEVYDTVDLLERNWDRILAARQEVIFASRTYEAERRQFELGVRTSTDVLDAAARLAIAQLREIHALVDHQISQIDIAYATGTLLGYTKVHWESI